MTLDQAKQNSTVIIRKIGTVDTALRQRLLDMGITRGTKIIVERVAPLGDPIEILIKNYHLAIRKSEAAEIMIEIDNE